MQKKLISLLLVVVLVLTAALPAFAKDITAFGFDNNRQRRANGEGYLFKARQDIKLEEFNTFWPCWENNEGAFLVGKTYSQPLILSPDKFQGTGLDVSRPVVIIFAANRLYAYEVPSVNPAMPQKGTVAIVPEPLWGPIDLPGGSFNEEPSASHPTYYQDSKGRKWIYVGTVDGKLAIVDLKGRVVDKIALGGVRITSAPLVTEYMGQTVVIAGGGRDGNVYVVTNFGKPEPDVFFWKVGDAVTSSPAPLYDNSGRVIGFAIANDGGSGSVGLFEFSKILKRDSNGWLVKTGDAAIKFTSGMSGIPASFAVEGKNIYFSDKKGNFYKLTYQYGSSGITNAKITKLPASKEFSHPDTFINRSPALDSKYVYFPIVDYKGQGRGMVVAVDKATGEKAKVTGLFQSRAVTAPVILEDANLLLVGTEGGWMSVHQIEYSADSMLMPKLGVRQFAMQEYKNLPRAYSEGICSEISVANGWLVAGGTFPESELKERGGVFMIKLTESAPDFIIDKIDPGTAKAKPGKTYSGIIYASRAAALPGKDESDWGVGVVPIRITYHGDITLKGKFDVVKSGTTNNGMKWMQTLVILQPGESVQIPFEWTAPSDKDNASIRAEINPLEEVRDSKGNINTYRWYTERNFDNNAKMVTIPIEEETIDLIAQQGEYNPALMVGEEDTYSVLVRNTGDVAITTDLVWRQDGKQIKKVSITIPARSYKEHAITFTMPNIKENSTVKLEAEVNPGRNKPPSEKSFANNKVTFPVKCLGVDQRPQTGGGNPYLSK